MNEEGPQQNTAQPRPKNSLGVPIAIIIAALLVSAAIYFGGGKSAPSPSTAGTNGTQNNQITPDIDIAPVTEDDHIRGNPNAPILIVEYSDYDCPFCKNFHETMNQIMVDFGAEGKVAWIYRHLPLEQLHPDADKVAAASECVAEQGGDEAFWLFSDQVFEERETNELTDITRLSEFAVNAGADKGAFDLCYNSGKYEDEIKSDIEAGLRAGARGTPYSIVMVGNQRGKIEGAQPYPVVKQIIETLLSQIEGGTP